MQILIQKDVYRPHVSIQDLQNAHRKGSVLRGKVIMERGNSDKMDVVLAGHKNLGPFSDMSTVRILGRDNINRAINGDVVYVKVIRQKRASLLCG